MPRDAEDAGVLITDRVERAGGQVKRVLARAAWALVRDDGSHRFAEELGCQLAQVSEEMASYLLAVLVTTTVWAADDGLGGQAGFQDLIAVTTHLATVTTRGIHRTLEGKNLVRVKVHVSAGARSALLCETRGFSSARCSSGS